MDEVIKILLQDGGIFALSFMLLLLSYKVGHFTAPLLKDFLSSQQANQGHIASTLQELADLHVTTNLRLTAIEKRFALFEEYFK